MYVSKVSNNVLVKVSCRGAIEYIVNEAYASGFAKREGLENNYEYE